MEPIALPNKDDVHIYDELASTNQTLWELMQQGANAGTVAIAHQQSAGKGQWGRQWQSSRGGLYLSYALAPQIPVSDSSHLILSTVCGVALALRAWGLPVQIKWPNDLVLELPFPQTGSSPGVPDMLNERGGLYKLGGILTETRIQGPTIGQAVVGIGLNGANPVPDPGITVMDLRSCLRDGLLSPAPDSLPSPLDSLSGLAAIAIYGICLGWHRLQSDGIEAILQNYNALLAHRERIVEVEIEGTLQPIQILGVHSSGDLLIRLSVKQCQRPHGQGTSSNPQPSREEIRIPPGAIQLGYRQV